MTEPAPRLDRHVRAAQVAEQRRLLWAASREESAPWHAGANIVSGVLFFGGAGWLLDRWWGTGLLTPVGVVLGMLVALTGLWFRYGVERPTRR